MMVFTCVYYHWILGKKLHHVLTQSHHFPWKKKEKHPLRSSRRGAKSPSRSASFRSVPGWYGGEDSQLISADYRIVSWAWKIGKINPFGIQPKEIPYQWYIYIYSKWIFSSKPFLVGGFSPTPLKNDGVSNSWDDDLPNWMESHKIPWFQTTNPICKTDPVFLFPTCGRRSSTRKPGD